MADPKSSSGLSRRIGSQTKLRSSARIMSPDGFKMTALLLHVLSAIIALPVLSSLIAGDFLKILGSVISFALMLAAARVMRNGLRAAFEYQSRRVAQAPVPRKMFSHLLTTSSVYCLAWLGAGEGWALAALYAALAGIGSVLAYGMDPRGNKDVDPELAARAGLDTGSIIAALNEAQGKLVAIEADAREIRNRELVQRLDRIVASGRRILDQIERDPSDIRRARRFLVTYLDGTRDVVSGYLTQQHDISNTPLGENFRHVLETVERVFAEQEAVLKRNETLDLEVQIDVLRTQMEREGVA